MSTDATHPEPPSAPPASAWHSIRPWTPPVSLSVREITSVSVTFTLSASISDPNGDLEPLSALGLTAAEEEDENEPQEEYSGPRSSETKKKSIISDALAKGVSVDVNSASWQRVFIRIDDGLDEAIIIIYGLMPGREYDVKLGLVQGDSNGTLRQQVTTEETELEPSEIPTEPESPDFDQSTLSDPSPSTPSTSPNRTLPNTPPSAMPPFTIEDRHAQLQHTLGLVNTERETLTTTLKSTRRDAQKVDAGLRSEIEILKRASEKHAAADHRAKQKILSLQEAVKRAQSMTRETEELVREVEESMPEMVQRRQAKEIEYAKVKAQADRVKKERDLRVEKENKKLDSMKGELTTLTNKMDKLALKKEKLENSTITELEDQLRDIEREIEQAEKDTQAFTFPSFMEQQQESPTDDHSFSENIGERSSSYPYAIAQRIRSQPNPVGPIGRPAPPAPIKRPTPGELGINSQQTARIHVPRQPQSPQTTRSSRSSSVQHQQAPNLPPNLYRHSSLKSPTSPSTSFASSLSGNLNSSPPSVNVPSTSTLSSRAPAFEPGRPLQTSGFTIGTSSGFSATPLPIQRSTIGSSRSFGFGTQTKTKTSSQQTPWAGLRGPFDDGRG